MKKEQSVTLLLLEAKAEWPTWGTRLRLNAAHSCVEVQQDSETLQDFHIRVSSVLKKLKDENQSLRGAGYVCSTDCTQATSIARQEVCKNLLSLMQDLDGEPELTIAGGAWACTGHEGMARVTLMELWGELSSLSLGPKLSVKFEDAALGSDSLNEQLSSSPTNLVRLSSEVKFSGAQAPGWKEGELKGPSKVREPVSGVRPILDNSLLHSRIGSSRLEDLDKIGS